VAKIAFTSFEQPTDIRCEPSSWSRPCGDQPDLSNHSINRSQPPPQIQTMPVQTDGYRYHLFIYSNHAVANKQAVNQKSPHSGEEQACPNMA
jgi:hypothetical protein